MRYDAMKRRLGKLEVGAGTADAVLRFADGSQCAVNIHKPLQLFCAACARLSFLLAEKEGARPASRYDELIDLFGRAVGIHADNNKFLYWIQDVCRQCIEEEQRIERGEQRPRRLA